MTRTRLDLRAHLLDRQITDVDGRQVGVVDDVIFDVASGETTGEDGGPPCVAALATGRALSDRILGGDVPEPGQLSFVDSAMIAEIDVVVTLSVGEDRLGQVGWVERWMRDHLIARIPGNRRRG